MTHERQWALGAIHRDPEISDYAGIGRETASRRATAICVAAIETGAQ